MHGADGEFRNPFDQGWRSNCGETCRPAAAPPAAYVLRRGGDGSEGAALLQMEQGEV